MNHSMISSVLAVGMLACASAAQPRPGQQAPEFAIEKAWNGGPKTFAEMKGRAVMLDFFATW
jgi:hypothetical protein